MISKRLAFCIVVAGCGSGGSAAPDAPAGDASTDGGGGTQQNPNTLADTGLCSDPGCQQISPDAHEYVPRFALWADTATKRRWIALPPGAKIDTSDPDHWVFPVGTRVWKEFSRDGVRVETRYITKIAADETQPSSWFYVSFAWNQTQDHNAPVPRGVMNANGTQHDIPSRAECRYCHDNLAPSRVLGFGAIQLDHTDPNGMLDLDKIDAMGWLSQSPPAATNGAHYPFPADATAEQRDTLGYLHANCGHCHNPTSSVYGNTAIELRLTVGKLATLAQTTIYSTTTNAAATVPIADGNNLLTQIVVPKDPANSVLSFRVNAPITMVNNHHMPDDGSEMTDPQLVTLVADWINSLK